MSEAFLVQPSNRAAIITAIMDRVWQTNGSPPDPITGLPSPRGIGFVQQFKYEVPTSEEMQGADRVPVVAVRSMPLATFNLGGHPGGPLSQRMSETWEPVWDFDILGIWPHDPPREQHYEEIDNAVATLQALYMQAYNLEGTCENTLVLPGAGRTYIPLQGTWWAAAKISLRVAESLNIEYSDPNL